MLDLAYISIRIYTEEQSRDLTRDGAITIYERGESTEYIGGHAGKLPSYLIFRKAF